MNYFPADGQILKDSSSLNLVKKSIDNIYNFRFRESEGYLKKLAAKYPEHPVVYLLNGMQVYWENYPLSDSSSAGVVFENDLRRCISLCEGKKDNSNEAELLLANLSARGFLLLFYLDNDLSMSVIPLAASTYKYIRRSFDNTSVFPDFCFFTGIYDYTREAYPEAYPVYKPLAILFPRGDKSKGLNELKYAAKNSIFLKAEAAIFLSDVYLGFENNLEQAYFYSRFLFELYPANAEYLALYIQNSLLTKRYDEAEKLITSTWTSVTNAFYHAQLSIFRGVLQEKKYKNDRLAEQSYIKGIKDISPFRHYRDEYVAFAYFGLSRISERRGDTNLKKYYRKKAMELTGFGNVSFD
jgi:hypothetical protein